MYCGRRYQTNDLRQVLSKAQTMLGSPISNQSTFYVNPQEDNIVLNMLFKNRSFTVGMDNKIQVRNSKLVLLSFPIKTLSYKVTCRHVLLKRLIINGSLLKGNNYFPKIALLYIMYE